MSKRRINKVAVIGSGIMGSGIACHFANIGVEVLLLDIIPFELNEKEKQQGLSLKDKVVRIRLVNESLAQAVKSKPSPLYHKNFLDRISTGNLEDDISKINDADWIIEVVVERLDIKKQVFEKLEQYRYQLADAERLFEEKEYSHALYNAKACSSGLLLLIKKIIHSKMRSSVKL